MGVKLGAAVYKTHLQVLHFKPRNSSCEKGTHKPNTGAQTEGYTGCLSPLSHAHTAGAAPLDAFLHGIEPEHPSKVVENLLTSASPSIKEH